MKVSRKTLARAGTALLLAGVTLAPTAAQSPAVASATGTVALTPPAAPGGAAQALAKQLGLPEEQVAQRLAAQDGLSKTARAFRDSQGDKAAGVWLDVMKGEVHANVLDDEGERAARAAGIIPQRAAYTTAELRDVHERLNAASEKKLTPGDSSWSLDTEADRVTLDVPAGTDTEALLRTAGITGPDRAKVSVTTHQGTAYARTGLVGGDGLRDENNTGTCSAGIMIKQAKVAYLVTAGHCWLGQSNPAIQRDDSWRDNQGNTRIGRIVDRQFPASDYALIEMDNPRGWTPGGRAVKTSNGYNEYYDYIRSADDEIINGGEICASGVTSGWRCGKFLDGVSTYTTERRLPNGQTETYTSYNQVKVLGMKSQGGDSGGAALYNSLAVGTVTGGSTTNTIDPYTYIQPLSRIARDLGPISTVDW
ncbi:S1 family peptidase [Kitasatospora sp. NPDC057512]|uniref:S1 family peptidase n=1 Tax=Kitasatospora sp. NPDC057512 TaxID=3346154 RepID=UPI0036BB6ACF